MLLKSDFVGVRDTISVSNISDDILDIVGLAMDSDSHYQRFDIEDVPGFIVGCLNKTIIVVADTNAYLCDVTFDNDQVLLLDADGVILYSGNIV